MLIKLSNNATTRYNGWPLIAHDTKLYHERMHCFYCHPIKQVTVLTTKKYIASWFKPYCVSRALFKCWQNLKLLIRSFLIYKMLLFQDVRICQSIHDYALNIRFIISSYQKIMYFCQPDVFSLFLLDYLTIKRLFTQRKALQIVLEYSAPYSPCEDG